MEPGNDGGSDGDGNISGGGGGISLPADYYYSGDGFEDGDSNTMSSAPREKIPSSISLNNGASVVVQFGNTASDGVSANQPVSPKLITALKNALNFASQSVTISSIYIKATTNGSHSSTSNHYKGLPIDISRINNQYVQALGSNSSLVRKLQEALDAVPNRRETLGHISNISMDNPGRYPDIPITFIFL